MPDRLARPLVLLAPIALLAACAPSAEVTRAPDDPFEAQNRQVHAFNRTLDRVALRPTSQVYGRGVPAPARDGVGNFVGHVSIPGYMLNDLLQGNVADAGHNFFRFALNSTLGVAGIFDPATEFGLEERESDFGQTLAVYGVAEGPYLEVPFYGPSTSRDLAGDVVDLVIDPFGYLSVPDEIEFVSWPAAVAEVVDDRYRYGTTLDQVLYESADSYAQTRELYLQNRRYEVGGSASEDYLDPYADLYDD